MQFPTIALKQKMQSKSAGPTGYISFPPFGSYEYTEVCAWNLRYPPLDPEGFKSAISTITTTTRTTTRRMRTTTAAAAAATASAPATASDEAAMQYTTFRYEERRGREDGWIGNSCEEEAARLQRCEQEEYDANSDVSSLDLGPPLTPLSTNEDTEFRDVDRFHGRKWGTERVSEWVYYRSGWIAGERELEEVAEDERDRVLLGLEEEEVMVEGVERRREELVRRKERVVVRDAWTGSLRMVGAWTGDGVIDGAECFGYCYNAEAVVEGVPAEEAEQGVSASEAGNLEEDEEKPSAEEEEDLVFAEEEGKPRCGGNVRVVDASGWTGWTGIGW
jgi:hypothetical protein